MDFTDAELDTIAHCLGVAAERFDEDARTIADELNRGKFTLDTIESWRRLIFTFEEQARQARALRERIDSRE